MRPAPFVLLCVLLLACSPVPERIPEPASPVQTEMDPEMQSAVQQARDTLDSFIEKIGAPHPDRAFVAVKVRFFPPDDAPQDIWVDEVTYAERSFRGNIGDDIPSLKFTAGEKVTVARKDIVDWMIVEDGILIGGYTIRLAVQRMSPDERERFLETLDYSIED